MGERTRLSEIPKIVELNSVEGFDPSQYLRAGIDSADGAESDYLDVKYRVLWFRARYPYAKVSFTAHLLTDSTAIFECRVYMSKDDPVDNYLASGFARRTFDQADPLGRFYVESAATAALGRALGIAGFGSQFCDRDNERDPDPVDAPVPATPPGMVSRPVSAAPPAGVAVAAAPAGPSMAPTAPMPTASRVSPPPPAAMPPMSVAPAAVPIAAAAPAANYTSSSPVELICAHMTVEEAKAVVVPFKKGDWVGKNLAWVAQYHPEQLAWLRDDYAGNDNVVRAAATVLINAAMQVA